MACAILVGCSGRSDEIQPTNDDTDLPAFSSSRQVQTSAPEEEEVEDRPNLGNPHVDEAELARTERTFERPALAAGTIRVSDMRIRRGVSRRTDPIADRERLWDLAALTQEDAEATALLRISASEHEFENELDTLGIFQVMRSVRVSHCDNTRFGDHVRRRITQCETASGDLVRPGDHETIEGARETRLSAMRRLSERALGVVDPRTRRGQWISTLTLDCTEPDNWPEETIYRGRRRVQRGRGPWEGSSIQENCREIVVLVRGLLDGSIRRRLSRANLLAWGGRCERHCDDPSDRSTCRQTGACDDSLACRRGLRRIESTATSNAFWCRPGEPFCPEGIEPVCQPLGYGTEAESAEATPEDEEAVEVAVDETSEENDTQSK